MVSILYKVFVFLITVDICTNHCTFFAYTIIAKIHQIAKFSVLLTFLSNISVFAWFRTLPSKMTHLSTIIGVAFNFCHISLALSLTILFRFLCLFFVGFVLRVLFFLAFLVRTISCFVSDLSTVATLSFELFFSALSF